MASSAIGASGAVPSSFFASVASTQASSTTASAPNAAIFSTSATPSAANGVAFSSPCPTVTGAAQGVAFSTPNACGTPAGSTTPVIPTSHSGAYLSIPTLRIGKMGLAWVVLLGLGAIWMA